MSSMKIWLRANERIYVNGAVLRFDRKTSIEFLNDVQFLVEKQVMQEEHANTPMKRLYFQTQEALMNSDRRHTTCEAIVRQLDFIVHDYVDPTVGEESVEIRNLIACARYHEAMKKLRTLFPLEKTKQVERFSCVENLGQLNVEMEPNQ